MTIKFEVALDDNAKCSTSLDLIVVSTLLLELSFEEFNVFLLTLNIHLVTSNFLVIKKLI